MLKLEKRGPIRVLLVAGSGKSPGVSVTFAPVTAAMRRRAYHTYRTRLAELGFVSVADADPVALGDLNDLLSREIMRMGAVEWQGIADEKGKALALTPDQATRFDTAHQSDRPTGTIDDLLANEEIFAAIDDQYVKPEALRHSEKNVSSASPNGISAEAMRARGIASSAARPKVRRTAAKAARTASTRSRPKAARKSGKS